VARKKSLVYGSREYNDKDSLLKRPELISGCQYRVAGMRARLWVLM
jgi:hypothetical protein